MSLQLPKRTHGAIVAAALLGACAARRAPPPACRLDAPALSAPPREARCILRGEVRRTGVAWLLRTRLDAIPSLRVDEGTVTAWLLPGERGHFPSAIAQVENRAMLLRAHVAQEDLLVVANRALTPLPGMVTDGVTQRPVLEVEGDRAWLQIDVAGAPSTVAEVPCSTLALSSSDVDLGGVMPPARGELVIEKTASLWTGSGPWQLKNQWYPGGAAEPAGVLAEARGDDSKPGDRLVSIRTCGGWLFGTVPKEALLGPPKLQYGSSARCPHTGSAVFGVAPPGPAHLTCARDVGVFVRGVTLEDPVGVLKANTPFWIDHRDRARATPTTRIVVEAPPAYPLEPAEFSVRTVDLAECR